MLIGMLHHRKNPTNVIKAYAHAAVAKAEGAELIYFSPKCVNFEAQRISGYMYNNGTWEKTEKPFPDVIYNAGSPEKLAKSDEIIEKLRDKIPFTTNSIGNKNSVFNKLKNAGEFSKYLIPSEVINSVEDFFKFLKLYSKIIFKPIEGHMGQGIYFIEKFEEEFNVSIGNEKYIYSLNSLSELISNRLKKDVYLAQPYINSRTKSGIPYDFRLHVQKDGEGKWTIPSIYVRFRLDGSIVTNISSGGCTNYLLPFLKQEFGDEYLDVQRYLEVFALQLAHHMEEIQMKRFSERLDGIGIDVGLDEAGKIWIYEVNWRPGCPPAFYLELDVVINTIRYAMLLAKESKGFQVEGLIY